MKLEGKVALITGTSPNIGGGIALGMADEGAKLVCIDLDAAKANGCATQIRQQGGEALSLACDVTDEAQVKSVVAQAVETFGSIDILVNAAVIFNTKGVLDMPVAEWRQQIDVILTGAFLCTQHVAQVMINQGRRGAIINIISTAGHQGEPWNVGYSTGKSGMLNFTRSVAMELAEFGIRVNSLTPTATDPSESIARAEQWGVPPRRPAPASPRRRGFMGDSRYGSPMQVLPSPRHYARAAVFLASDDAEMITGEDLRVDTGTVACYWRWDPSAPLG